MSYVRRYEDSDPAGNAAIDQKHAAALEELRKANGRNWLLMTSEVVVDGELMSVRVLGGGTADDRTTRGFLVGAIRALVLSLQELEEQMPS